MDKKRCLGYYQPDLEVEPGTSGPRDCTECECTPVPWWGPQCQSCGYQVQCNKDLKICCEASTLPLKEVAK